MSGLDDFRKELPLLPRKPETPFQKQQRAAAIGAIGLDKLDLKEGDVVVITCEPEHWDQAVGTLRQLMGDAHVYICLKPGQTVEAFDEGAMRTAGWVKARLRGRLHLPGNHY